MSDISRTMLSSFTKAAAVTPSDSTDLTRPAHALYIGVTGDVTAILINDTASVTFTAVPVGIFDIQVDRVLSTGTTASGIRALFRS